MQNLLTVSQVAKELGVTPGRVRHLIMAGRLHSTLVHPRLHLIDPADVESVRVRVAGRPWPKKTEKERKSRKRNTNQVSK